MITQGRHSVNVSRKDLLAKLKENVAIHKKDYAEALIGYKIKLVADLKAALEIAEKTPLEKIQSLSAPRYDYPRNYESEYNEIIDMMEVSVDDVIQLDSSSFKQYFKNEWAWSSQFNSSATLYKAAAFGASGAS
jgi:CO dehydrogenase/acetyl-CoA synthase alpha subunit